MRIRTLLRAFFFFLFFSSRHEPALTTAEAVLDELVTEMIKRMDKPFAFFGRGLGSQARLLRGPFVDLDSASTDGADSLFLFFIRNLTTLIP